MSLYPVLHHCLTSLWTSFSTLAGLPDSPHVLERWRNPGTSWECLSSICFFSHRFPGMNLGHAEPASLPGQPCSPAQEDQGRLWPQAPILSGTAWTSLSPFSLSSRVWNSLGLLNWSQMTDVLSVKVTLRQGRSPAEDE